MEQNPGRSGPPSPADGETWGSDLTRPSRSPRRGSARARRWTRSGAAGIRSRWRGNLDALLPKPAKLGKRGHWPTLALADAAEWFAALRRRDGISARALEFLALTVVRSGEVRGATWGEIDLEKSLWTIPAERMMAGKAHRNPLTAEAKKILESVPRLEGSDHVFPAPRGGALSDMALQAVMRPLNDAREAGYCDENIERAAVVHGLRSTFRD